MAAQNLALDSFWIDRSKYSEAETNYYERHGLLNDEGLTPLTAAFVKARERIRDMKRQVDEGATILGDGVNIELPVEPETKSIAVEPNKETEMASKQISTQLKEQSVSASTSDAQAKDLPQVKEILQMPSVAKQSVAPESKLELSHLQFHCNMLTSTPSTMDADAIKFLEKKVMSFHDVLVKVQAQLEAMDTRLSSMENAIGNVPPSNIAVCPAKPATACTKLPPAEPTPKQDNDDDDVDLFGSDSEDDESANKLKEARVAAYNAKKSKKPALIAKSSIVLDVKPWDDETDMKALEDVVRKISCDGLLWGASKFVPLAYGIRKLQINCVVEDDKVSIDWLQEQIEANEDYVQSVDIAAFNKI